MSDLHTAIEQKRAAALAALDHINPGSVVGLGSGSTAEVFVAALGARVKAGLSIKTCVASSERTAMLAAEAGLVVSDLNTVARIDVTVDGADEIDGDLNLIKGGGGAHLREKLVAMASERFVVIADASKAVHRLGAFPLPVEVVGFGWRRTAERVAEAVRRSGCKENFTHLRGGEAHPYRTDQGHFILDVGAQSIPDPHALAHALKSLPGVVDHGLFLDFPVIALIAGIHGVTVHHDRRSQAAHAAAK